MVGAESHVDWNKQGIVSASLMVLIERTQLRENPTLVRETKIEHSNSRLTCYRFVCVPSTMGNDVPSDTYIVSVLEKHLNTIIYTSRTPRNSQKN